MHIHERRLENHRTDTLGDRGGYGPRATRAVVVALGYEQFFALAIGIGPNSLAQEGR